MWGLDSGFYGGLDSGITGYNFETETVTPIEIIDLSVKFNGPDTAEYLDDYIAVNQAVGFNLTYDVQPISPVARLRNGETRLKEISIVDGVCIIETDVLTVKGKWILYIYDTSNKTPSQSFIFKVKDLP